MRDDQKWQEQASALTDDNGADIYLIAYNARMQDSSLSHHSP